MLKRQKLAVLQARLAEKRRFVQVVAGPRQVGKTTLVEMAPGEAPTPTKVGTMNSVPPGLARAFERKIAKTATSARVKPTICN